MDITQAFNAPVTMVGQDGKTYQFPKFSPPDIAEAVAKVIAHRVADAKSLCDECGITGTEKLKIVREAKESEPVVNWVWMHACTPAGAVEIVTTSLKKLNKSDAEIMATLEAFNLNTLTDVALFVTSAPKNDKPVETEAKATETDPKKAEPTPMEKQMAEAKGYGQS